MGQIIKKENCFEYQQDDGKTTAWFSDTTIKKVLAHKGDPVYKTIFYILISLGIIYLGLVFSLIH